MKRFACALLAVFVACGGKAVIDAEGSGGAGGVTSAAGSMSGPASSTNGATTSTTTNLCQQACAAIDACLDDSVDCVGGCSDTPGCEVERDAFLQCFVAGTDPDTCSMPADCPRPLELMLGCDGRSVGLIACSAGGQDTCDCTGSGADGVSYDSFCEHFVDATRCDCVVAGEVVGSCTQDGPVDGACDLRTGCCAGLLYIP